MVAVRYFVSDVDQSVAFYERFGFEVDERWGPAFVIMKKDGVELWLSGPATSAMKPMADGRVAEPGGWNRIVVVVCGLPDLYADLKSNGYVFRNEPLTGPGGTQVILDDPDGNPVELFEPAGGG